MATRRISNWNRYPVVDAEIHSFRTVGELRTRLAGVPRVIARGAGLSYGDASLALHVLSTLHFNKILEFDAGNGWIRCESGVTLDDLLHVIVPKGWFLPVTPGTKFITLGGAVAADIHGKNHHKEGSLSQYVTGLSLMTADGNVVTCGPREHHAIFKATCGGMGLTGVILGVAMNLKRIETSYIKMKTLPAANLHEMIGLLTQHNDTTYSVAWIDCMTSGRKIGRGVLMLGEHARYDQLPGSLQKDPFRLHAPPALRIPFDMPAFLLNRYSIRLFNTLYNLTRRLSAKQSILHYDPFFYPLDSIKHWNRMYGKRGFLQYQFVLPFGREEALVAVLQKITESRLGSFLSVLKLLGDGENPMAFPRPGYTLALDFPVSKRLFTLLDELDVLVTSAGGRVYLAKDARMKKDAFEKAYPDVNEFRISMRKLKSETKFESILAKRLAIFG